ncbi:5'-nucleotidase [Extensimonas sp. H3M7-6]|uniref:5'-nucleotidase n=1 Tax=Extensimonas soli TaxID=3031322 RepID=UPI0023DA3EC7|nr:5'-nucleotidase [Extensimonas sp. H3M7-6]MDF1481064.1 5'-nucleotidase [Extensimonas sp. H3M7-6]
MAGIPSADDDKLVVAISSRALFDFEEENRVFDPADPRAYMQLQLERLDTPARPGVAFSLVRKLLAFNAAGAGRILGVDSDSQPTAPKPDRLQRQRVEVVVLSRNDPVSGMRVFRSVRAHGLTSVQRGVFTQGAAPFRYLRPLGAHLFLSANEADVREALALGFPAAQVATQSAPAADTHQDEVRIAFDGDAVLFSDEAERVYQTAGLDAFQAHEAEKAALPLPPGPFKPFLAALHRLQQRGGPMRIRTALVTARGAPAHERAIQTLMHWNIAVDEAMFLGGMPKGPFLREFEPDFFFDDQTGHVLSAAQHVPAGLVRSGIAHETQEAHE